MSMNNEAMEKGIAELMEKEHREHRESVMRMFAGGMKKYIDKDFKFCHENANWSWWRVYRLELEIKNGRCKLYFNEDLIYEFNKTEEWADWDLIDLLQTKSNKSQKIKREAALAEFTKKYKMYDK